MSYEPPTMIGTDRMPEQWGSIGRRATSEDGQQGPQVAIAFDGPHGCNAISLFGVQGFGKSYTLGTLIECATQQIPRINVLPAPLATVVFHYHSSDVYEPEILSAVRANSDRREVGLLASQYGALPEGLRDVLLLVPSAKVEERRREYPGIQVEPILFSSAELKGTGWKYLLGAYGNDALYLRTMMAVLREHRDALTIDRIRRGIAQAMLQPQIQALIEDRLRLAEPYVDDSRTIGQWLKPGRVIVVDLRDAWVERQEALELFVVLMDIFTAVHGFNKLIVFDEAHKYLRDGEIATHICESVSEMRHHGLTVLIASQDPSDLPRKLIELSSILVLHRMTSPAWIKHLKGAVAALDNMVDTDLYRLTPGEALVWAQRAQFKGFTEKPQRVLIRPRVSAHGGGTKTARR